MTFRNLRNKAHFNNGFKHSSNQAILLTLTTASGKTHTVRLMKLLDIFGHMETANFPPPCGQ